MGNVVDSEKSQYLSATNINFSKKNLKELSGITIGKTKLCTHLDLSDNYLKDVPYQILNLRELEDLNLSQNAFDKIPNNVCRLLKLKHLNLMHNRLFLNPVNPDISKLYYLEHLNLSYNQLEELPNTLFKLLNLRFLDLSNNEFKTLKIEKNLLEDLPPGMSLPHCTILDLSCNPLNVVPVCVQELQALENLHLDDCSKLKSWNEIRKPWKYLRQCHIRRTQLPLFTGLLIEWNVLEYLSISENSSINDFPSDVVILENLKTFEAQKCGFSFIPTSIGNLSSLTHLDLRQNQYSDASFSEAFGKLKHLVYLNLSENRLSTIPECFLLFSELKELDLSHNRITIIPDNLWRLHKLEKLNLSFNCLTSLPDNIGY
ncbi:hypothetical protein HMI54_001218 [Coelomomyces lativittatus]|nr:hypothetical protein HMI54_001218 [Coelomomyces lativittatus]